MQLFSHQFYSFCFFCSDDDDDDSDDNAVKPQKTVGKEHEKVSLASLFVYLK